jgi:hypothetical protein
MGLRRFERLDGLLNRGPPLRGELDDRRAAPERLGERSGRLRHLERELLGPARHVDRPARVAEVAPQLPEDGRRGEPRKRNATLGVKAVDRRDEREARDLHEVLARLVAVAVAQRETARKAKVAADELAAGGRVELALGPERLGTALGGICGDGHAPRLRNTRCR